MQLILFNYLRVLVLFKSTNINLRILFKNIIKRYYIHSFN